VRRLPFTVIGGFLGAGKTTLLNRLLRAADGRRFAVLVNDFGAIDIDSRLVVAHGGDTISLANGCICCSIGDSLVMALIRVLERAETLDHVVVEASGVADPARIAELALIEPMLHGDGVIVLADATSVRDRAADRYLSDTVTRQLAAADLLILNKADLVAPEALRDTAAWLGEQAPGARLLTAAQAAVPVAALFDLPASDHPAAPMAAPPFRRWSFSTRRSLPRDSLLSALAALPDSVLRGKGMLRLAEDPTRQTILQMVGRRVELTVGAPWGIVDLRSDIVLLGTPDMPDDTTLERLFEF